MISLSLLGQRPLQPWQGTPVQQSQGAQIGENWRNQALEEQKRQGLARLGGLLQDPNANRGAIANELSRLGQTGQALDVAFPKVAGGADPEEIKARLQSLQKSYLQVMGNGGFAEKIVSDKATDEDYKAFSDALDKNAEDAGMLVSMKVGPQSFKNWVLPDLQELKEKAYNRSTKQEATQRQKEVQDRNYEIAKQQLEISKRNAKNAEERNRIDQAMASLEYKKAQGTLDDMEINRITKGLQLEGLSSPEYYNTMLEQARLAKDSGNVFSAVKTLANVIEPGLSVTEGEVQGYTVGGGSKFDKWVMNTFGAGATDLNKIYELSTKLINNKAKGSRRVVESGGDIRKQVQKPSAPTQGKAQPQQTAKPNPFARFKK